MLLEAQILYLWIFTYYKMPYFVKLSGKTCCRSIYEWSWCPKETHILLLSNFHKLEILNTQSANIIMVLKHKYFHQKDLLYAFPIQTIFDCITLLVKITNVKILFECTPTEIFRCGCLIW